MNRRLFLKWLGIAPLATVTVTGVIAEALQSPTSRTLLGLGELPRITGTWREWPKTVVPPYGLELDDDDYIVCEEDFSSPHPGVVLEHLS